MEWLRLDPDDRVPFALGPSRVKASPSLNSPLTARRAQARLLLWVEAKSEASRTGFWEICYPEADSDLGGEQ